MSHAERRDRRRRGAEQQRRRAEAEEQRRAARRAAAELSRRTAQAKAVSARGGGRTGTRKERRAAKRARIAALPLHRRRRRRLLRWSWLPALVLLAFAWNLSRMAPGYAAARDVYDHGDAWRALEAFEQVKDRTIVERWKASFNAGTAALRAGMHTRAVTYLDEALAGVPEQHRCDVQTNRALALQAAEASAAERAQEQLAYAEALGTALAAQAAGEPYDPEDLEPRYGDEPPVLADELSYASFLIRIAADHAALAAQALGDPACTPPPSQGGGGEDEQEDQGGGGGGQDEQGGADEQDGQDGQDGDDASSSPQAAAEQRMQDLLDLAAGVDQLARATEDGTIDDLPAPGSGPGDEGAPDPAQAEAGREQQLAERNGQAVGGGDGTDEGEGQGGAGGRGGGDQPGTGGGGRGGRNW